MKKNQTCGESREVDIDEALTMDSRSCVYKQTEITREESGNNAMADAKLASKKKIFDMDVEQQRFNDQMQKDKDLRRANFDRDKIRLSEKSRQGHDAIDKMTKEETKRHIERMQIYKSMK